LNGYQWIAMMNTKVKLATMFIVALGTIGTAATAFAQTEEDETEDSIEIADQAVHEFANEQDVPFHQALCEVGITTEALEELGGCDILPDFTPELDDED
jgi:hypothetical protein